MNAHKNIEVKESSIQGLGIFARRALRAVDYIQTIELEGEITDQAPLNKERGERIDHCIYPGGKVMLVAFPARHMNHSCDPNAYYIYEDGSQKAFARRAIDIGTEITVDYLINNPGGDSWPCHCGAARCRGATGVSFFDLPIEIQKEYYPLLAPWFKERCSDKLLALEGNP